MMEAEAGLTEEGEGVAVRGKVGESWSGGEGGNRSSRGGGDIALVSFCELARRGLNLFDSHTN